MTAQQHSSITITVGGVGGIASASFSLAEWKAMSPVSRVLALHERLRHVTRGRTFDVMAERITDDHRL